MNLKSSTSESARPVVREYFDRPVCSDENADAAYRKYLMQRPDRGLGFGHWLEAEARQLTVVPS